MRLKSFQAKNMQDALRQVKEALGDDAIIVSSREEASGWVRITAAVEHIQPQAAAEAAVESVAKTAAGGKPARGPAPQAPAALPEGDEDDVIETITDALLKHRVPGAVSERILAAASLDASGDPLAAMARGISKTLSFSAPLDRAQKNPLILVGPPGAGKTLMTAKLAAHGALNGRKPTVITTDIARAGGVEQLTAFLDILGLPLQQAEDEKSLRQILDKTRGDDIIVDTGGLNPFDPQEMKYLARLIAAADLDPCLVLPAGGDAEESAEIAMTFEVLGVKKLIPTRLDFARRLGGILSAAHKAHLALGTASHTPQVAQGIVDLTPLKLAELLLPRPARPGKAKEK